MTSSGRSHWASRAAARGGGSRERRRLGGKRDDGRQELGPVRVREARADLAGVAQAAVLVDADQERAEVDRLAGPLHPATDDELLLGTDLDLLPRHRPRSGHVRRAAVLGHDPLEAPIARGLEERDPLGLDMFAQADARIRAQDAGEEAAPFLERFVDERSAVKMKQVEDLVDERGRLGGHSPPLDPGLEQRKIGFASRVESDDLAIDDRPARVEPGRRIEERPEVARRVLLAAGPESNALAVHDGLDAETVPLDLEQPVRIVEGRTDQRREHRRDEFGRHDAGLPGHRPYDAPPPDAGGVGQRSVGVLRGGLDLGVRVRPGGFDHDRRERPVCVVQAARTSGVNASPSPCWSVHSSASPTVA